MMEFLNTVINHKSTYHCLIKLAQQVYNKIHIMLRIVLLTCIFTVMAKEMKDSRFNPDYKVGSTMLNLEEGKYNLDDHQLGQNAIIECQKNEDKVMIDKKINDKPDKDDTMKAPDVEINLSTLETPTLTQPLIEDCKNVKCAETVLCEKPIKPNRKRKNMFSLL